MSYPQNSIPDPVNGPFSSQVPSPAPQPVPPVAPPAPAESLKRTSAAEPIPGVDASGRIERRKVSAVWIGFIVAAVLLIVLVVFIAQNSATATVNFLWLHGHISFGLALLLAAVIGALLVAVPGSVRIIQLRRSLKGAAKTVN